LNPTHDLDRFVAAQNAVWPAVLGELAAGTKRSHWMWFVFPQIAGLGHSATSRHYALASVAEAQAYLGDARLGARLRECTDLVLAVCGRSAHTIFGSPDDLKFRSSMTLFAQAAPGERRFAEAIERFFAGQPDAATLRLLAGGTA
jgi:uncharacterized protein (DUF1810 family)